MTGLGASKLITIGAVIGIFENVLFNSQSATSEILVNAFSTSILISKVMRLGECHSVESRVVITISYIYFVACVVCSYLWYSSRATKPIRDINKRFRLFAYASTPVFMLLICFYVFQAEICQGVHHKSLFISQRIELYFMPALLNCVAAVGGFFSAISLYALLNQKNVTSEE